jgi:large subunit ribosomal protein L29
MKTNITDLRLLSTVEMQTKLQDARQEVMNLRFQAVTGQLTDTSRIPINRKLIARYETLLRERELASAKEGDK